MLFYCLANTGVCVFCQRNLSLVFYAFCKITFISVRRKLTLDLKLTCTCFNCNQNYAFYIHVSFFSFCVKNSTPLSVRRALFS